MDMGTWKGLPCYKLQELNGQLSQRDWSDLAAGALARYKETTVRLQDAHEKAGASTLHFGGRYMTEMFGDYEQDPVHPI